MENIKVKTNSCLYPIYFASGFDLLEQCLAQERLLGRKLCIITDDNVSGFYLDEVLCCTKNIFKDTCVHVFEHGEGSKNLVSIEKMYDTFLDNKLDRKSVVMALGGGVTGDMAGFAAATYLRGITYIQIPTTLLSQVDSSVGGKVGVDFKQNKNLIGAFYQPYLVYININSLKTLPEREFSAGMAEVIKYGMILDAEFLNFISEESEKIKGLSPNQLLRMIQKCCLLKAHVVSVDEKESGMREILNFGHTIGHAIETLFNFELLHGECVALGMRAAAYISYKRNGLSEQELVSLHNLLSMYNLPAKFNSLDCFKIYDQMKYDKKVKEGNIGMVLLSKIGSSYRTADVSKDEILEALNIIRE